MRTAIGIFVKTPGLSPVKTRLAKSIGRTAAEEFYRKSIQAVEAVAMETQRISQRLIHPYWAVGESNALGDPQWENLDAIYSGPGGLGQRMHHVYMQLLDKHDYVMLIGSDTPQISPQLLVEAAAVIIESDQFVLGPAQDGGFYLLGGSIPIDIQQFTAVPYSVDTTAEKMIHELRKTREVNIIRPLTDVDEMSNLIPLFNELQECNLPEQTEMRVWLYHNDLFADRNL